MDTAVVAQAPRRMLVEGLGDALAIWYKARTIQEAQAINSQTSSALAKLCCDILLQDKEAEAQAVDAKAVTPALERVVEANTLLSGLGFESGGLCVAHSVHNGLTLQAICAEYIHGEKVVFGLLTQLVLEGREQAEIKRVLHLCKNVVLGDLEQKEQLIKHSRRARNAPVVSSQVCDFYLLRIVMSTTYCAVCSDRMSIFFSSSSSSSSISCRYGVTCGKMLE